MRRRRMRLRGALRGVFQKICSFGIFPASMLYMHYNGDMRAEEQRKKIREVSSEVTRSCMVTRTRQISRVLTAIYDQELRPFGLSSPQFSLLVLITELGPVSRSDLGRRNHQDRTTLSRNLQLLLSRGWVSEDVPAEGGRRRPLSLTEEGRELLLSAAPAWSAAQMKAKALLGEAGVDAIMDIAGELPRRMS
jgi:DNA-binding MarR family transcriptional regulator